MMMTIAMTTTVASDFVEAFPPRGGPQPKGAPPLNLASPM